MTEESKEIDPQVAKEALHETITSSQHDEEVDDNEPEEEDEAASPDTVASGAVAKKKRSKKSKLKKALGVANRNAVDTEKSDRSANPASKLTTSMVEQLLEMNPSLKNEVAGMSKEKAAETIKKLDVADLLTGMVRR